MTNLEAGLSTEPDGAFFLWETLKSGKIILQERAGQGIMELVGTPAMTLEVVSRTSKPKDAVILRDLYGKAGIPEYWLVDARVKEPQFDILRWTPKGYETSPAPDGWVRSDLFNRSFQILASTDPLGHPQFKVLVRE